jgi:hypothetical protein|tara:strand:- start:34 stop:285 length:252 start_codon:yes stop_codon:yes gene_type:complete
MGKQFAHIGRQLRVLRIEAGFSSYVDFAWMHDMNKTQYGRMETGSNFTLKSLQRVLDVHQLSFQDFFELVATEEKLTSVQTTP